MNIFSCNVFATLLQPVWPCSHCFWSHCSIREDWGAVINSPHYFSWLTPQGYIFCSFNSPGQSCWVGISPPSRGVFQSGGPTILQGLRSSTSKQQRGSGECEGTTPASSKPWWKCLTPLLLHPSGQNPVRWPHLTRISWEMESSYGLQEKKDIDFWWRVHSLSHKLVLWFWNSFEKAIYIIGTKIPNRDQRMAGFALVVGFI